ncbi:hypothetical protein [Nonomuraea typhae]|uniref:WXG100 family type VII secretion target n=1 Tax=Nonomuraea typhae TaxID=2603600 RepID=A0ABW7YZQ8_9ACTN
MDAGLTLYITAAGVSATAVALLATPNPMGRVSWKTAPAIPLAITAMASSPERIGEVRANWEKTSGQIQKVVEALDEAKGITPPESWAADDKTAYDKEAAAVTAGTKEVQAVFKAIADGCGGLSTVSTAGAYLSISAATALASAALIAQLSRLTGPAGYFTGSAASAKILMSVHAVVTKALGSKKVAGMSLATLIALAASAYLQRSSIDDALGKAKA